MAKISDLVYIFTRIGTLFKFDVLLQYFTILLAFQSGIFGNNDIFNASYEKELLPYDI